MAQPSLNLDQSALDIVREAIGRATREEPISIRWLLIELRRANLWLSDRRIKQVVEELRRAGTLIGSSRQEPFGYWTPRDEAEEDELLRSYLAQAFSSLKLARLMMAGSQRAQSRGAGQLMMDFVRDEMED